MVGRDWYLVEVGRDWFLVEEVEVERTGQERGEVLYYNQILVNMMVGRDWYLVEEVEVGRDWYLMEEVEVGRDGYSMEVGRADEERGEV